MDISFSTLTQPNFWIISIKFRSELNDGTSKDYFSQWLWCLFAYIDLLAVYCKKMDMHAPIMGHKMQPKEQKVSQLGGPFGLTWYLEKSLRNLQRWIPAIINKPMNHHIFKHSPAWNQPQGTLGVDLFCLWCYWF